jgi:putative flippase GtrA
MPSRRAWRFLLVGGVNTVWAMLVFVIALNWWGPAVPAVVSLILAWVISGITGYVAQRYLVFKVRGRFWLDLIRFASVNVGAFVFNVCVMGVFADVLGFRPLLVQLFVVVCTVVFTYFGHSLFSFYRGKRQ